MSSPETDTIENIRVAELILTDFYDVLLLLGLPLHRDDLVVLSLLVTNRYQAFATLRDHPNFS